MSEEINKVAPELPTEAESLKTELEEQKNRYLRLMADFDNYKKRVALEQDQFVRFANERLMLELLPILDNFERALKTAEDTGSNEDLVKGLHLVIRQMQDALKKFGAEEIEALDKPYDPNVHEAIMDKKSEAPENMVIEVVQKGYILHGKVLRPSMVIVSKKRGK